MKHLKRSACHQKKKAVIGIKGSKTFPGSLSFVQRYQKELIHIIVFHKPNQLLQLAEMLGSTLETEHEPLQWPVVPLQLQFPTAATFAKVQRAM